MENKNKILEILKEMPIIEVACKRAGIGRATYYRWRKEDKDFLEQSENAMAQGFEFINDMSESQIVTLIREKKMPAITLWLKHHHPYYGASKHQRSSLAPSGGLNHKDPQYTKIKEIAKQYEDELRKTIVSEIHDQ